MRPIKRILVGLDLTDQDQILIKFASFISKSSPTQEIYFINLIKTLNIPDDVKKEFPDLIKNAVRERKRQLKKITADHLDIDEGIKVKYIVRSGPILNSFLNIIDNYEIDLVVVGRKPGTAGSGVITQRLARRSPVNLLIVPEGSEASIEGGGKIKKILVPADFSKHSSLALEYAIDIAKNTKTKREIQIYCQNVFSVPTGYHYTGKSYNEFAKVIENNARKNYEKFIKKINNHGINIKPVYTLNKSDNFVESINKFAHKIQADGIIFGAKGISASSALFIGSIAEKMIKLDSDIPLMIVRKKDEKARLIDYIRHF